jgi:hypothetical protein
MDITLPTSRELETSMVASRPRFLSPTPRYTPEPQQNPLGAPPSSQHNAMRNVFESPPPFDGASSFGLPPVEPDGLSVGFKNPNHLGLHPGQLTCPGWGKTEISKRIEIIVHF